MPYKKVAKILQSNCRQTTKKYVPVHSMWLSRVFRDLANTEEYYRTTGPGSYQTQPSDPEKQVFYLNQPIDDELYNVFITNGIKAGQFSNGIYFKTNQYLF